MGTPQPSECQRLRHADLDGKVCVSQFGELSERKPREQNNYLVGSISEKESTNFLISGGSDDAVLNIPITA